MYRDKRILAIIPARGGSKGIPHKNIKKFDKRPLIYWTFDEVVKSRYIDACVVSTEDKEIMNIVRNYQLSQKKEALKIQIIKRPKELAADNTPSIDPVLHVLDGMSDYNYVVLLQVTSPMRTVSDIDGCIEHCLEVGSESCVSVCEAESSPYWMYTLTPNGIMKPFINANGNVYQRQKLPKVYQLNGAVYVAAVPFLHRVNDFVSSDTLSFLMSNENSGDIDTLLDFEILEYLHVKRRLMKGYNVCSI